MKTTEDSNKPRPYRKRFYDAVYALVLMTIMLALTLGMVTETYSDISKLFIRPRIEDYHFLRWLVSVYIACHISLLVYMGTIVVRAFKRLINDTRYDWV